MNPDLRNLIVLQDIELRITALQKKISDVPSQVQTLQSELERLRKAHQDRVAYAQELGKRRRTQEGEVDLMRAKLSRLKDQLNSVKTNKEFTAMRHEIEMAESHIRSEEDKILEVMEQSEVLDQELKKDEKELNSRIAELEASIRATQDSVPAMEAEVDRLRSEREKTQSSVERELLERYRRIAGASKGIALAEARNELCTACHVRIRPQVYADLMRTENIYSCDSCSRILFFREPA